MNGSALTSLFFPLGRSVQSVGVVVLLVILMIALESFLPGGTLSAQELATDDPPVNFRVTGFSDTSAGVAWAVPRNRGITNFVLERYDHNGTEFVLSDDKNGTNSGGSGWIWAYTALTPDTRYKFVLYLKDAQDTTVIEKTVTVRTLTAGGSSTVSNDAALSGLTLSGIDFGSFQFQSYLLHGHCRQQRDADGGKPHRQTIRGRAMRCSWAVWSTATGWSRWRWEETASACG